MFCNSNIEDAAKPCVDSSGCSYVLQFTSRTNKDHTGVVLGPDELGPDEAARISIRAHMAVSIMWGRFLGFPYKDPEYLGVFIGGLCPSHISQGANCSPNISTLIVISPEGITTLTKPKQKPWLMGGGFQTSRAPSMD